MTRRSPSVPAFNPFGPRVELATQSTEMLVACPVPLKYWKLALDEKTAPPAENTGSRSMKFGLVYSVARAAGADAASTSTSMAMRVFLIR